METQQPNILADFLTQLKVRHTYGYTVAQFRAMPFQTLFGMTKLLEKYGVATMGLELGNVGQISELPAPFIAQTKKGLVIVTDVDSHNVSYISQGKEQKAILQNFEEALTGKVLLAKAMPNAAEPELMEHLFSDKANKAKKWVLAAGALSLFAYLFVSNKIYTHVSSVLLTIVLLCGVYISWLLVQKSAHIKNKHADAVCSVVEAGGCDDILGTSASKFFGIFGWSEVGMAYFSVSLLALLVFPQSIGALALCNLCCLPFSFWSVWYQKFKAKTWCTLCLCVQSMLWMLFFCFLFGGWLKQAWHIDTNIILLCVTYLTVMLGINATMPLIDRKNK